MASLFVARQIALDLELTDTPPMVAYVGELRRIVTMLVANAYETMHARGRILVRTRLDSLSIGQDRRRWSGRRLLMRDQRRTQQA